MLKSRGKRGSLCGGEKRESCGWEGAARNWEGMKLFQRKLGWMAFDLILQGSSIPKSIYLGSLTTHRSLECIVGMLVDGSSIRF